MRLNYLILSWEFQTQRTCSIRTVAFKFDRQPQHQVHKGRPGQCSFFPPLLSYHLTKIPCSLLLSHLQLFSCCRFISQPLRDCSSSFVRSKTRYQNPLPASFLCLLYFCFPRRATQPLPYNIYNPPLSSSMSIHSRCPSSLVPWSRHNPDFVDLVHRKVTMDMVKYIAQQMARVIPIDESHMSMAGSSSLPTPPHTPAKATFAESEPPSPGLVPLEDFIVHLINGSNVQVPTLLTTLIYLRRLKAKLPQVAKGASLHSTAQNI